MMKKRILLPVTALLFLARRAPCQPQPAVLESRSSVNWISRQFLSTISLDMEKSGIVMPTGKASAVSRIRTRMPVMIKDPLLSLFVDSSSQLGDLILSETITLEQITQIIEESPQTPAAFSADGNTLSTDDTIDLNEISRPLLRHRYPYLAEEPVDTVASRPYTGIIVDARGALPVHGEYTTSGVYACFFPEIWDEEMNLIYERNTVERAAAEKSGIAAYDYSDDQSRYEDRIGPDPLYVRAFRVFGRNRTDPVIRRKDALKIVTVPENRRLLTQGRVVILLDKDQLVYDVSVPDKDEAYYTAYGTVKSYLYENKVPDVDLTDGPGGIKVSIFDLKFIPDSPELLPEERPRINEIARLLLKIIKDDEFSILVEGHTADVGKPVGQMNLSVERTRTVMNALIEEGVPKELFSYRGYGGTRPVDTNDTEEGRAQNRRVDITARPKTTYIQRDR